MEIITFEVEWECVFHANGTFEKIATPNNDADEIWREQSGFFAINDNEFVIAWRSPSEVWKNWEGTWLQSQDYLILRRWDDKDRLNHITILKKV